MKPILSVIKNLNLLLRFIVELCLLAAAFYIGQHLGSNTLWSWVFSIGLSVLVVLIWGRFMAPKSKHQLAPRTRIPAELLLFGCGVAGLWALDQTALALALGIAVIGNEALLAYFDKQHSS